jgi:hypothetical protein
VTFTVPLAVIFIWLAFEINEILAFLSRLLGFEQKKEEDGSNDSVAVSTVKSIPRKVSSKDASSGVPFNDTKAASGLRFRVLADWFRHKTKHDNSPA